MHVRTLAGTVAAVAALAAVPAAATAMPPHEVPRGHASIPTVTHVVVPQRASTPTIVREGGGSGAITIVLIGAGTLLAGAASGFTGGRVLTRRAAVRA